MLSLLGEHLINLTLLAQSNELPDFNDLDCLSSLSRLTSLHIASRGSQSVWGTQGQLSLLTSLQNFTYVGEGRVQGPLTAALATLPHLTQVKLSYPSHVEVHSMQFPALQVLKLADMREVDVQPLTMNMMCLRLPKQCPPEEAFGFLTEITICDYTVAGKPWPLRAMPTLTIFKLKGC